MIRKDIFAVKEYDRAAEGWCYTRMYTKKESADKWAKGILKMGGLAKIVHPSQDIVSVFLLCQNRIEN